MQRRIVRYDTLQSKTILNAVKSPMMPFQWSINPYRGCQHGCSFCYARSTHSFLGEEADDTFQNHIFLKSNAAEALEAQLEKLSRSRKGLSGLGNVAIGTATDPYQPVEATAGLTRACLELLARYEIPTSVTTRSPLILKDLDLLKRMNITSVNISINTLDSTIWKQFEPSTPSPSKRLETVKQLSGEGISAGIFMAPILPLITDRDGDLARLIEGAAKSKAAFVMSSFLRLSTSEVKVWFFQTLQRHYPQLVGKFADMYRGSAYAPDSYRAPVAMTIQSLLAASGLNAQEPYRDRRKEASIPKNEEPVQLSFSF